MEHRRLVQRRAGRRRHLSRRRQAFLHARRIRAISIHEAGHALAIRHFGRRVRKLGVAVYYLFPCMYVDATDMVMAPRYQRVIVAFAGPLAGLVAAGLAMLVVIGTGD
ncbi:MAG: site-2 protease family protein [Chloroflexi bacterium]|nr:site-2 protease family protein [Chloroflexota bacterium]